MEITWYGHSCFRLKSREASVVIDPYAKGLGLGNLKLQADLVLTTHDHPGHNNVDAVSGWRRHISGPGEYETAGVFVHGLKAFHDRQGGAERGLLTIYNVQIEDVMVCHLGDINHRLDDETLEGLGQVDVLLVPVGAGNSLNAAGAAEVVAQVSPRIAIPMHCKVDGVGTAEESDERFLKEMGVADATRQPKLTMLSSSSPGEEVRVVLLQKVGA